jgi:ketosteroid isomerase-like protein
MRHASLLLIAGLLAALPRCASAPAVPDVAAQRESLLRTDREFSRRSAEKGRAEAFLAYMAEGAMYLPPGAKPVTDREEVRRHLSQGPPDLVLTWEPIFAEVSTAGDLGCTIGEWKATGTVRDGKPFVSRGKYLTVWKRQADGTWKWVTDLGNEDPPPAPASSG